MQKLTTKQYQKYFRKDRGWLLLNAMVYSAFGCYSAKVLFSSEKAPINYVASGIIFLAAVFSSIIYWKSFNMYLIIQVDRVKIKGWWQEINILFSDIEKYELYSPNYSKRCILHLKRPMSQMFLFSNLPLIVLKKDSTVISLDSFLSEQDWLYFEKQCDKGLFMAQ